MEKISTKDCGVRIFVKEKNTTFPTPFFCGYIIDEQTMEEQVFASMYDAKMYWEGIDKSNIVSYSNRNALNSEFDNSPYVASYKNNVLPTFEYEHKSFINKREQEYIKEIELMNNINN